MTIYTLNTINFPLEALGLYILVRGFRTGYKREGRVFITVLERCLKTSDIALLIKNSS